ncbi:MAG TPA: hypothetical protein VLL75_01010, partial [Vicinamibacteria bacterium]|nr:hypothetical protein [Vicinamibacteria bacterium]
MTDPAIAAASRRRRGPDPAALAGAVAALLWTAFCVLWFDVAAPWRPPALAAAPPLGVFAAAGLAAGVWLWGRR